MKSVLILCLAILLAGCSSLEISSEGAKVAVKADSPELARQCKMLGAVEGYGADEEEAEFDIRHNAKVDHSANAVVINVYKTFYQTQRMRNYIRRPELKKKAGTRDFYYENGFTIQATGMAYRCKEAVISTM